MGFNDRIDWTRLFAKSAKNTFGEVNVVARGTAAAVVALLGFNRDSHGRTHRFAQFAGDTRVVKSVVSNKKSAWCVSVVTNSTTLLQSFKFKDLIESGDGFIIYYA